MIVIPVQAGIQFDLSKKQNGLRAAPAARKAAVHGQSFVTIGFADGRYSILPSQSGFRRNDGALDDFVKSSLIVSTQSA